MTEWIGAAEAANRLGIKPASLYAYVSRGVLTRRRGADGRASLFDADEVAGLARKGRPRRPVSGSELVIESAITEITDGTLRYRGLDATWLARNRAFEDVAGLLWTGELPGRGGPDPAGPWQAMPEALAAGRAAQVGLARRHPAARAAAGHRPRPGRDRPVPAAPGPPCGSGSREGAGRRDG